MPDFDAFRDMEDRVVFAGCIVPEVARPYACGRCGEQWGGTGR